MNDKTSALTSKERCGVDGCVLDKGHSGSVHNTTAALVEIARACAVDLSRVGRPTAADGVEAIAKEVQRLRDALDRWESPSNWGVFVELLGLPIDHVNKPLGVAAGIALLNRKFEQYQRCLYRANGRLTMLGQEPEKLDYSGGDTHETNAGPLEDDPHPDTLLVPPGARYKLNGYCDKCRREWIVTCQSGTEVTVKAFHCPCGHVTEMDGRPALNGG